MPQPKNTFTAVVKLAEREHDARHKKRHVRRRNNDLRPPAIRLMTKIVHKLFRIVQMLDQVHQQNLVIPRHVFRDGGTRGKWGCRLRVGYFARAEIDRRDVTKLLFQFGGHVLVTDA